MPCTAHCDASASVFDAARAAADRKRYERRGPDSTTRLLLEGLRADGVAGRRLLDVGGGIGVIGVELARDGLAAVHLVEAAPGYASEARELFRRAPGAALELTLADFAEGPDGVAADLVTLDRVVCCYPRPEPLLARAAASCRATLGLSFPRDRWYVRLVFRIENLFRRIRGSAFRAFVHPPAAMHAVLSGAGLRRTRDRTTPFWRVEQWTRAGAGGDAQRRTR